MEALYLWLVVVHLMGLVLFTIAHGASAWAVASPYYMGMRRALEERGPDGRPTIEPSALARMLDTRRPEMLSLVGTVGLVLLVWLMVIKPG